MSAGAATADMLSTLLDDVVAEVRARRTIPAATYRLQFHNGFSFDQACGVAAYLRDLGISHIYASPLLQARPGSVHGYDVRDFTRFDDALGGDAGFDRFSDVLRTTGLGLILDVTPNHMSADASNPWWRDVLENGPTSPYAHYFDIDWDPVKAELANKVLVPLLGEQYGVVLESGQLLVEHAEGEFRLRYFDHCLPLGPKTVLPLLTRGAEQLVASLGESHEAIVEFKSIITAIEHLPPRTATSPAAIEERQREKEVIKRRLRTLEETNSAVHTHILANVAYYNGDSDEEDRFAPLDTLLSEQAYRLCHWRVAADEINYRRFFDINELAAICMEHPDVFAATHERVLRELGAGRIDGLRIDHVDGLFAPVTYLWRLQWGYLVALLRQSWERVSSAATADPVDARDADAWSELAPLVLCELCRHLGLRTPGPDDWCALLGKVVDCPHEEGVGTHEPLEDAPRDCPLFVQVEKILGAGEPLPESWPVAGTTGYDFTHNCAGLFLDPLGWGAIENFYHKLTADPRSFDEVVRASKLIILRASMSSQLQMLAHQLDRLSEQHRRTRDFTLNRVRYALREMLIYFPVYRVYPDAAGISAADREFILSAVNTARRQNPAMDATVFDFLREVLLLKHPQNITDEQYQERELFVGRLQQLTSPVMAKGIEDTAFYTYVPLVSVNEVGNDPREAVVNVPKFHTSNVERAATHPHAMLSSSTHDSKRTEDVRARLHVLSEMPHLWRKRIQRWTRMNRRLRAYSDGQPMPCAADEYLFYQSLVGIWPLERPGPEQLASLSQRLQQYMEKATHEAKQHTSWINPDVRYDQAVRDFVAQALDGSHRNPFLENLQGFVEQLAPWGLYSSVSQLTLKMTSPGFPDFYQGQELWDFSLVDPDNRRPVDFERRQQLLAELRRCCADDTGLAETARQLAKNPGDERLKMFVTWRLLGLRRECPQLFATGEYLPLDIHGVAQEHVVAFLRRGAATTGAPSLLVVVPRLLVKYALDQQADPLANPALWRSEGFWQDTTIDTALLSGMQCRHVLTGDIAELSHASAPAELLRGFPVGVWLCR